MKSNILELIDFEKVNTLLEGFNKSTGFVTAILDLEGNVLSKSGWRKICTNFHRVHPDTAEKCKVIDTVLAGEMAAGEKYHFYKCKNGLIDVAVPIIINDEHVANLFSGQFFFEKPDLNFFKKQAGKYKFDN
jgi:ligand-binding sensor protein